MPAFLFTLTGFVTYHIHRCSKISNTQPWCVNNRNIQIPQQGVWNQWRWKTSFFKQLCFCDGDTDLMDIDNFLNFFPKKNFKNWIFPATCNTFEILLCQISSVAKNLKYVKIFSQFGNCCDICDFSLGVEYAGRLNSFPPILSTYRSNRAADWSSTKY